MKTHRGRRRLLLAIAVVGAGAFLPAEVAGAATAAVSEVGTAFQPPQVDILVGDRVVWTNRSNTAHSVSFQNGPDLHPTCTQGLLGPVGDCQEPGAAAQYTFTAAGNFAYRCKLHDSMRGVVVVSATAATTTSATVPATTATTRATTTTTRAISTSSSTTRPLATSSTLASSTTTTTTDPNSSVLLPGDPPPFTGEGSSSSATGDAGGDNDGGDTATVALIVALLLAVSAVGGYLLWRLRPGGA
jgi:plastocyanin